MARVTQIGADHPRRDAGLAWQSAGGPFPANAPFPEMAVGDRHSAPAPNPPRQRS
ncbi:hypothetical protein LMIY3S_03411 [Labrys miyagiensis]